MQPAYLFETSWEVCQKIGGIYAVLSTRARIMQAEHPDKVFFIGPDVWQHSESPYFQSEPSLLADWTNQIAQTGLKVRVGRWLIPGQPISLLIDFHALYAQKNAIYGHFWELYQTDSLHAYGDYDDSCLFAYAAGMVIESLYHYLHIEDQAVTAHFNEWQTAFGLLYIKEHCPNIGTLFTTHATSIGRSIAGNNKPLYDYFEGYHGDQMAEELNMQSKHSAEKAAAHHADCFTTVSDITARECAQLLDKQVDIVTPNGFEMDFVPQTEAKFQSARKKARKQLQTVAERVLGYELAPNTRFAVTSGRYEWKNKGIDLTLAALSKLSTVHGFADRENSQLSTPLVLFILVPAWTTNELAAPNNGFLTHALHQPEHDPVLNTLWAQGLTNQRNNPMKVIFAPVYLDGKDGLFNMTYYDLLAGFDFSLFPSYYEPWGYTPLESVAFRVPTLTTNLAGFGVWAAQQNTPAVKTIYRTDSNFNEAAQHIAEWVQNMLTLTESEHKQLQKAAYQLAKRASWQHFFAYYREAYEIALRNAYSTRKP